MQITINVPDQLADRIAAWAELTQQPISDMLETALDVALPPLPDADQPITQFSDEELVALTHVQMSSQQGERLAQLQRQQRESVLSSDEKKELLSLMQRYNTLWVRKSQALALAVRRGLIPPLSS